MSGPTAPHRPDRAGFVIAILLAVLAGVIFYETRAMKVTALYARVGPTTLPYVVATVLGLLAIGTAISAWRGGFPEREPERVSPILWIVAGLVLQLLLLKPDLGFLGAGAQGVLVNFTGFSIATGLLFAFTAKGFGRGPLWLTIPIGIVFALLVWLIFSRLLMLSLPAGPLERLIP